MSKILSTIGDYTITERDVDSFISSLGKEQQMYRDIPDFRSQILLRLEEISLFAMLGKETKVEETDVYKEAMKNAKRDVSGQLAMQGLLKDVKVTDEEAKEYFESHKSSFATGPSASAKHILVDTEEKADSIKEEIASGSKSFEDAAREYSTCPSGQKGGSLGTFGRGQMVKEFDQAVFEGDLETIIGPVGTQFGYHLIWIDSRDDGETPEFEQVKDKVKSTVLQQKQQALYNAKISELRSKYKS